MISIGAMIKSLCCVRYISTNSLQSSFLDNSGFPGLAMNFVSDSDASWSTNRSSPPIEELWKSVDALSMEE